MAAMPMPPMSLHPHIHGPIILSTVIILVLCHALMLLLLVCYNASART